MNKHAPIPSFDTAAAEIRHLAAQHGVRHSRSRLDELGDAITRLAGDDVEFDETEWLLVELGRRGILSTRESLDLQLRHNRELHTA